jgi:hypothetical protein
LRRVLKWRVSQLIRRFYAALAIVGAVLILTGASCSGEQGGGGGTRTGGTGGGSGSSSSGPAKPGGSLSGQPIPEPVRCGLIEAIDNPDCARR